MMVAGLVLVISATDFFISYLKLSSFGYSASLVSVVLAFILEKFFRAI